MIMRKIVYFFAIITFFLASCEKDEETVKYVSGLTLNKETQTLEVGDTVTLFGTISPEDATNKTIYWNSSAGGVATVSDGGLVTAVSEGFTMIKAQTEDGGFEAYCNIIVVTESINVTGSSLNITGDSLDINCTLQLTVTVSPENATNKGVDWSTSDETIATVSADGLVTGVGGGIATITVTTNDGNYTANCEVFVLGKGTISTIMDKGFLNTPGKDVGIDLAIDANGVPYLALNKYDASLARETKSSCEVWKYSTGTGWNQFGPRVAITDDEAFAPGLVIDEAGTVHVSHKYFDDEHDPKYGANAVAYSSGVDWTYLGTGNFSLIKNGNTKLNQGSDLALKEDGTLLVANMYYGDGFVHYWDGSLWKSYNGYMTDSENFWAGGIDIKCYGNVPYVSVRTGSGTGITGVLFGDETNGITEKWNWLGNSYASSSSHDCSFINELSDASLAINSDGDVFTAYKAYYDEGTHVFVKAFTNGATTWTELADKSGFSFTPVKVDVVVANDILYLLVAQYDSGIDIYRLSACDGWILEGSTPKIDVYYNFEAVAGKNGEIFIGYECTENADGKVGVFKYTPYSTN